MNKPELTEHQKQFITWMESLEPYMLLDLIMNCGYLLGKTIQPPKKENEDGKNSEPRPGVQTSTTSEEVS